MLKHAPISTVLSEMLHAAGAEPLTLDWLLGRMGERSFGLVLLLLSVFGLLPGVSAFAAVLLMVPAIQMLLARSGPIFPRGIRGRRFEARRLVALLRYVIPALRWLELGERRSALLENGETMLLSGLQVFRANICRK
jgi:hypothetical protein